MSAERRAGVVLHWAFWSGSSGVPKPIDENNLKAKGNYWLTL
ncbi:hypothetical protein MAE02_67970 [Microvirga aerophila]|uniref:Uncharacterized protein n=1 Tax=Microvirga aerophila TaxID=670291 RepID=A0A512C4H6_9HYPH|nr:hypothetical protein MAE02_67970 [Microvirga aerophila]